MGVWVFLPMHWGSRFLNSAGATVLTTPALDPVSRQPELKHAVAEVLHAELPREPVAISKDQALSETAAQHWLKEMMAPGVSAETLRPWVPAPLAAVTGPVPIVPPGARRVNVLS